jgi:hypothetical protein
MLFSPRLRFAAALVLFAAWVGALAAMTVTSATRPPSQPVNDGPGRDIPPDETPEPR